jgi:hypothetical protein
MSNTVNSNSANANFAEQTVRLFEKEQKVRGQAVATLIWALYTAHLEEDAIEGVNLAKAYSEDDRAAMQERNSRILAHVFKVMRFDEHKKKFVATEDTDKQVLQSLKTAINRSLSIVAWFIHVQDAEDDICIDFKNGILSMTGTVYYSDSELEKAPRKATNWLAIDGKEATMDALRKRADEGLGVQREKRGAKDSGTAITVNRSTVAPTVKALSGFVSGKDAKAFSKETLEELATLYEVIGNILDEADDVDAEQTAADDAKKSA